MNIHLPQRLLMSICAAIASLMLITLSYSIWQWHSDWVLTHQETRSLPELAKVDQPNHAAATAPGEHLFGKSVTKLGQMPVSNLQMRVTGIVKVSEQSGLISKAYIAIDNQGGKVYQIGDSLPYGVKVYDITSDAVILENNGQLEKLPLPREKLKFKPRNVKEIA